MGRRRLTSMPPTWSEVLSLSSLVELWKKERDRLLADQPVRRRMARPDGTTLDRDMAQLIAIITRRIAGAEAKLGGRKP